MGGGELGTDDITVMTWAVKKKTWIATYVLEKQGFLTISVLLKNNFVEKPQ